MADGSEPAVTIPNARAAPPAHVIQAVPVRHLGRMVAAVAVMLLATGLLVQAITNPRFGWDVVVTYFTSSQILDGLWRTIELTVLSMTIGIVLGVLLAILRLSPNPVLSYSAWFYIWFFRGTPLLVQIIFWFNLAALYPDISIGIPFGPQFVQVNINAIITPFAAAVLGLGLNEGAYMAEIVRAGNLSVDGGQVEAGQSLGMTRGLIMRRIVLPQAMRTIIPPTGNQVISMLKTTSLVSVVSLPELLYSAQIIYSRTYQTIPLLVVASIWYLIVTSILTFGQYFVERHFKR